MSEERLDRVLDVAILILSVAALALSVGILLMGVAAVWGVVA